MKHGGDKVHGRFCKKLLGLSRYTADGTGEMELAKMQDGGDDVEGD
jgi:hypothetical protein